ncbi:MAG: hypothetical protein N2258_01630 [Brevinematales bacterium]|nr:hypothetical protein [Brevinematales bacterium]
MKNKFLFILLFPSFLFCAATLLSPIPINNKFNISIVYDINNTNNIIYNFSLYGGYGFSDKQEIGAFVYANGILFNFKGIISQIEPFSVSGLVEFGYDLKEGFNTALSVFLDVELYKSIGFYIGARGRYPAVFLLNSSGREEKGVHFTPFAGVHILRNSKLSFLIEGGLSLSWANQYPIPILSCGINYSF